jgi:hypothetical protein
VSADVVALAVQWAVPAALGAVAGWLGRALRQARSKAGERERAEAAELAAIRDGMRSLLRCEIVRQHREHAVRGEPMTLADREYIDKTYRSYHELGGNGTGTRLYDELMALPIKAE